MENRPSAKKKNVTEGSAGVHKRGEGLGTGPVGSSDAYSSRTGGSQRTGSQTGSGPDSGRSGESGRTGGPSRAAVGAGGSGIVIILVVIAYLLFGGGLSGLMGGGSSQDGGTGHANTGTALINGLMGGAGSSSSGGWTDGSYKQGSLDTTVAPGSRTKLTSVQGGGRDVVTIMVYMCGTDLESKSSMATYDMQEMAAASLGSNVNLIVYTGGTRTWRNSVVSSSVNQIYRIKDGGLENLVADDGSRSMTDPATLSRFIQWGAANFPANRYELIFWDHGGGSVSGYGYDEKYSNTGSMDLAGINKALTAGGIKFDFIGFDACLMATAENALMLSNHGDYMIASEETEPGIGWYYTDWLTKLGSNTSMPTIEIGKNIIDDFVSHCATECRGQKTTLSIVDLAEFSNTVPDKLSSFAKSISGKIANSDYKTVSDARYGAREFASGSKIDQVDLINLCQNMKSSEGSALSEALLGAVKYNRTSSNMTNAYGVSIYFPYQKASYVDRICKTYDEIDMNDDYSRCIREFASLEACGQVATGGTQSPASSLMGFLGGEGGLLGGFDAGNITDLLSSFMAGGRASDMITGLDSSNMDFLGGGSTLPEGSAEYIGNNLFDSGKLKWVNNSAGTPVITLTEEQWSMVHDVDLNMFYDDGSGYIDMGLDPVFSFDDNGGLIPERDRTWVAINGQPVAYYHVSTMLDENGKEVFTGRVPVLLNGERAELIIVNDSSSEYGYIAGASYDYDPSVTLTVPKAMLQLNPGDTLDFVCDYYNYDGTYSDSYLLGEQMTVSDDMKISYVDVGSGGVVISYRFTDIYNQEYWSEFIDLR